MCGFGSIISLQTEYYVGQMSRDVQYLNLVVLCFFWLVLLNQDMHILRTAMWTVFKCKNTASKERQM